MSPGDDYDFAFIPPELDEGGFKVTARDAQVVVALLRELVERQTESLPLYEELPGAAHDFHKTDCFIRILRGSNRAGKTLTGAVEFARAVTGHDPHGKYPATGGIAFVFGLDGKHIGLTVFPKLFQPGAFKIIQDEDTGDWRAYKPWLDGHRVKDAVWAPPLIPPRYIREIAWEEKKTRCPKMITLINGWTLHFFSSLAKMPQGQAIDLGWIDEEIENERLIAELTPRLADREGKMFWTCTPQVGSEQLLDLHEKADAGDADVKEFLLLLSNNPYISDAAKQKLLATWTAEEKRVRWDGEYAYSAVIIYPEFELGVHGFDPEHWQLPGTRHAFQVPHDWALYACVDPGRQVCAVSFWAVPPPKFGEFYLLYHELYIRQCDAVKFGAAFATVVKDRVLEEILIDGHAGRINEMASGLNVEEQYRQQLVKQKVETRNPGCFFVWGSDDPQAGREAVHDLLRIRADGQPRFYILESTTPNFQWEIKRYRFSKRRDLVTDQPEKKNDHLMDTTRYLAMRRPQWVAPRKPARQISPAVRSMQAKKRRNKDQQQPGDAAGRIRLG